MPTAISTSLTAEVDLPITNATSTKNKARPKTAAEGRKTHPKMETILRKAANHNRYILEHYCKEIPEWMKEHGELIQIVLEIAANDVCRLEANAKECGVDGGFWERYKQSTNEPDFFKALCSFACFPPNKEVIKPVLEKGKGDRGAWIVLHFREMLRDGYSFEDALRSYGKEIGNELAGGNTWLLSSLARTNAKPARRSIGDWIIKAWLPLALWQKGQPRDGVAKAKRKYFKDAYRILEKMDAVLVPLPPDADITKAIGTVASKIKRRQR